MSATAFHKSAAEARARDPEEAAPVARPDRLRRVTEPRSAGQRLSAVTAVFRYQPGTGTHRAARRWRLGWRAGSHRGD